MIKLVLPGDPTPQARPRFGKRGNKTMVFDPQAALKRELKVKIGEQLDELKWTHFKYPRICFGFYMYIPRAMTKKQRQKANLSVLKHVKKPDVDNLIKLYLDVLTGLAFADDNCVSIGSAVKVYGLKPRTEIYIEETTEIVTLEEVGEGTGPTQNYEDCSGK